MVYVVGRNVALCGAIICDMMANRINHFHWYQLGSCSWCHTSPIPHPPFNIPIPLLTSPTSPSCIPQPPALLLNTSYWQAIWNSHMVFSNLADDCKPIVLDLGVTWPPVYLFTLPLLSKATAFKHVKLTLIRQRSIISPGLYPTSKLGNVLHYIIFIKVSDMNALGYNCHREKLILASFFC